MIKGICRVLAQVSPKPGWQNPVAKAISEVDGSPESGYLIRLKAMISQIPTI